MQDRSIKNMISVIVPIYNVEGFLNRCIDSLLKQNYKSIEIILVNDGSSDNSLKICKDYLKEYSNIVLISTTNNGVSEARNRGIKAARGEYITFVDPDDAIAKDTYLSIMKNSKKINPDIISYNGVRIKMDGTMGKTRMQAEDSLVDGNNEVIEAYLRNQIAGVSVCNKIIKRTVIKNKRFDPEITNNEDKLFLYEVLKNCSRYMHISIVGYIYYERLGSASNKEFTEQFLDIETVADRIYNDVNSHYSKYVPIARRNLLHSLVEIYRFIIFSEESTQKYQSIITRIRSRIAKFNQRDAKGAVMSIQLALIKYLPSMYQRVAHFYQKLSDVS